VVSHGQEIIKFRGVSFGGGWLYNKGGATVSAAFNISFPIVVTLFVLLIIDQSDIYCRVRWQHYILTKVCMTDIVTYFFSSYLFHSNTICTPIIS
jgi:hypothetical protein